MRFVAGRGAVAELLAGSNAAECHREDVAGGGAAAKLQTSLGAAAESHREDAADRRCGGAFAGLGVAAESHREDVAGWGAVAKRLAGTLRQTGKGTRATQKSQLRQTELALLKPLVVSKRNNL